MITQTSNRRSRPSKTRNTLTLLSAVLLALCAFDARAQDDMDWTRVPGRLYPKFLNDRVGIGTSNPQDIVHLYRGSNSTVGVLMG
ncbi:MAG: hypothetical protein ACREA0_33435, partial [bacterium]